MVEFIKIDQGTEDWKALRKNYATASDMPNILGTDGAYKSYNRVLKDKIEGERPISPYQQAIFDRGHEVESEVLAWAAKQLDVVLRPCVAIDRKRGLLASLDGYDPSMGVVVECKCTNSAIKAQAAARGELWEPHRVQVHAQMLVVRSDTGFIAVHDDVTGERYLLPVAPDKELFYRISQAARSFYKELNHAKINGATYPRTRRKNSARGNLSP